MAYNGSGTFERVYSWAADKLAGTKITASRMDTEMDGFATGLSTAIAKDGQTTVTADLPLANHKLTGLSAGSAAGHSVRWEQIFAGASVTAEVTVASATTTDILAAASDLIAISGTATITSFGTGTWRLKFVRATGAFTLTHDGTTLILPGAANIVAAAGDTFIVASDGSSNARVYGYVRASDAPHKIGANVQAWDADLDALASSPPTAATAAQINVGTVTTYVAVDKLWAAAAVEQTVTYTSGGTTTFDMSLGPNGVVTLTGGNSTLGDPSNVKVGQTGRLRLVQSEGARTLAYSSKWYFAGGVDPVLSTGAAAIDVLYYDVISANIILASLTKAIA